MTTDNRAEPLTAEDVLRNDRTTCKDCARTALRICPYHAGYEAGIRARTLDAARQRDTELEALREAAAAWLALEDAENEELARQGISLDLSRPWALAVERVRALAAQPTPTLDAEHEHEGPVRWHHHGETVHRHAALANSNPEAPQD